MDDCMFAKIIDSFSKKTVQKFFLSLSVFLAFAFSSKIRADVLILKNGQRIKADQVRMKAGNLVEIRIGNQVQTIEFSKVESILPEFSVRKKPKKEKLAEATSTSPIPSAPESSSPVLNKVSKNDAQNPPEINATSKTEIPKRSRWYPVQALIPGWSPLLLSDDYKIKATGGLIAFSELYILYKGFEFFATPERFFQAPFGPPASEAVIPWIASISSPLNASTNNFPTLFFQFQAPQLVVTQRGHIMEKTEFNQQKEFYGIALAAVLTLDVVLSSTSLTEGSIRSVRLSTNDGGRTSSIAITWVF